jgi:rhamnosyltransferase
MNEIIAGIVTYNPNPKQLKMQIERLQSQNIPIVVVDNASDNRDRLAKYLDKKAALICNKKNEGIARALNQIFEYAKKVDAKWVVAFDQDSLVSESYFEIAEKYIGCSDAAIYCPVIYDVNRKTIDFTSKVSGTKQLTEVEKCITSGAFTRVECWQKVKGFREELFIDGVDFEFCYRIRQSNYKIYQLRDLILNQSIGCGRVIKFGKYYIEVHNHNAVRKYYIARNRIYCDYLMGKKPFTSTLAAVFRMAVITILFESDKKEKLSAIRKGMRDGIRMTKDGCK